MTDEVIEDILRVEHNYAFILYTRTWKITEIVWLKLLQRTTLPTVSFHLDLYWGLERGRDLKNDSFFWSDYVFSADGGHQKEFKEIGCNHFWLPPAILKDNCFIGDYKKELDTDVIFVGHARYHKEWPYRPYLIQWLQKIYGQRFRLWGQYETIRGKDLNDLYNSAKVIVGDSTYSPYYWSDRIPETLGRAGFLVHPKVEGLEKQFEYYKHLIPYSLGNLKQLKEIIDYYIEHKEERDKIRFSAFDWVKKRHTYEHRIKKMLNILKKEGIIK